MEGEDAFKVETLAFEVIDIPNPVRTGFIAGICEGEIGIEVDVFKVEGGFCAIDISAFASDWVSDFDVSIVVLQILIGD